MEQVNFSLLLVLLTLVTGVVWALDKWVWQPRRDAVGHGSEGGTRHVPILVEFSRSFFPVILIVLLLRSFVVEPFRIPSGSMMPTLLNGDFILVNKFAYGLRLPVTHTKVLSVGEPRRGDVVVFRWPKNPSEDFIKRIVGLPGDTVRVQGNQLFIDGKRVPHHYIGPYLGPRSPGPYAAGLYREKLGTHEHDILLMNEVPVPSGTYHVPKGHYFVMGDNRDNSDDSRMWGFVPEKDLVGRAFLIWMNWDGQEMHPLWGRIGEVIH